MITIKQVFGASLKHLKIDDKLSKKIKRFTQAFINKNEDHVTFFGNALIGTPKIVWLPTDKSEWFEEVLEVDELAIKKEIDTIESIDTSFRVTGDAFNLSIIYMVHAFRNSRNCSKRKSEEAQVALIMLLQYKFLTSLMYNNFPHAADYNTAVATYASLNRRFSLKVHGSWNALLKARAEDVVGKDSIHNETIDKLTDDAKVIYVISDIQTRLRDVVKTVVGVFYQVRENDARILSSKTLSTFDGEETLTDKQDSFVTFHESLLNAVNEKSNFIRPELVEIISDALHTMPPKFLNASLEFITDNYGHRKAEYIEDLLTKITLHTLTYGRNEGIKYNDLRTMITRLRSLYMASKVNSEELSEIKELASRIVEQSVTTRNDTVKAAVRTGTILYIVLRMLTSGKYE